MISLPLVSGLRSQGRAWLADWLSGESHDDRALVVVLMNRESVHLSDSSRPHTRWLEMCPILRYSMLCPADDAGSWIVRTLALCDSLYQYFTVYVPGGDAVHFSLDSLRSAFEGGLAT